MQLRLTITSFFLVFLLPLAAMSQTLTQLGERSSHCTDPDKDLWEVKLAKPFAKQASQMFQKDRLNNILLADGDCLRVGTEIKLYLTGVPIPYLGRAFVQQINFLDASEVLNSKVAGFDQESRRQFVTQNPQSSFQQVKIKIMEKVIETTTTKDFTRLPTCFTAYSDWTSFRLKGPDAEKKLKEVQSGQRKADIWNGTMNCYKVGTKAKVVWYKENGDTAVYGSIIPRELAVIHHSRLTERHAKLFGMTLKELQDSLLENIERDGGYTTLVVYDYLPFSNNTQVNL